MKEETLDIGFERFEKTFYADPKTMFIQQDECDEHYATMNDIYHDGFEDGIKFFLRHLYTVSPVSSIEAREWGETLNTFRRWKSADEWTKLIEGEV